MRVAVYEPNGIGYIWSTFGFCGPRFVMQGVVVEIGASFGQEDGFGVRWITSGWQFIVMFDYFIDSYFKGVSETLRSTSCGRNYIMEWVRTRCEVIIYIYKCIRSCMFEIMCLKSFVICFLALEQNQ